MTNLLRDAAAARRLFPGPGFFARIARPAVVMLGLLLATGCAFVNDDEFLEAGDVSLSPIAVILPQPQVTSAAGRFAEQRPTGFVLVSETDDMLPRYAPGTVFVAELADYAALRRGMTVVFVHHNHRVAHVLVMKTSEGWITRGFNARSDDPDYMTERNYLGTVVMAFSAEPTDRSNP